MRDRKLIFTQEGRSDEINVSPLIDIVFILLIFFIVTTVYGGNEIGVRGVRGVVKRLLKQNDQPVIVQTDKRASVEIYTRVHDEAALAGAKRINLATQN
jgi:biopolymer transport protein ExbD